LRTSVDTNVLSSIWSNEPSAAGLARHLAEAQRDGALLLSAFVYSEALAHPHATEAFVQRFLKESGIRVDYPLPQAVWSLAGGRFAQYAERRRVVTGVAPRRILADFLIGAHAVLQADRLMTLDAAFYARNFPELRLYPV
jgi:predicted nucleic acid-binding protein